MNVQETSFVLDRDQIARYAAYLQEQERAGNTVRKYLRDLHHLFARTYDALEKDLARLADILGQSGVDTTRIYTLESGTVHIRQLNRMNLTWPT